MNDDKLYDTEHKTEPTTYEEEQESYRGGAQTFETFSDEPKAEEETTVVAPEPEKVPEAFPAGPIGRATLTKDLKGKAIVSIKNGRKIGVVDDLLIDPQTLSVAALVTSKGTIFKREVEAIKAEDIEVWGEDAILVSHTEAIHKETDFENHEAWLNVNDHIKGRSVVSSDGQKIGTIDDILVDDQGKMVGFHLSQAFIEGPVRDTKRIPSTAAEALGKDVLIVNLDKV